MELFHRHNFDTIVGHTEPLIGIRVYFKCARGRITSKRYKDNDKFIDECGFGHQWSGYTWWMHKPLTSIPKSIQ